ncbi:MAG: thioredoxin domain-containing protein [Deltaproteobacteria bacterium]|nr:thioredoxin domain-containing protein [Deltaproteobacteria bacterium]
MLETYPREVKLVFKNFPLRMHRYAMQAAAAAMAANVQGKFAQFHEKLFENYRSLNEAKIEEIATALGLDMTEFNRDRKDPTIQNLIARDIQDGIKAGIRGTPTVFINGKQLKGRNFAAFKTMIDAELKKHM